MRRGVVSRATSAFAVWFAAWPLVIAGPASVQAQTQGEPETRRGKKVEGKGDDAGEDFVRKAIGGGDEDLMTELLRLMDTAARRLDIQLDAGSQTQGVQEEIVAKLDMAIKVSAGRTKRIKSQRQRPGDRREMGEQQEEARASQDEQAQEEGDTAGMTKGDVVAPSPSSTPSHDFDVRRGWGGLPPRERDEVIQGFSEAYLEKFRDWIDEYYKALQEADGQ